MPETTQVSLQEHLDHLTAHLERENPDLLGVVRSFRSLDQVAYRLGLLERNESYAMQVPWWPLIAVLGTYSSGKSTFINSMLGRRLQNTGNQAVDDKFTVICHGEGPPQTLPALALDSDPRFPFYNISNQIEDVARGEGRRLDNYLQLKTCDSEFVRGRIIIDSPGFDADQQRTETLRITSYIIDLADLVLVFFDARHPEPGAMRDTLDYLVSDTLKRPDFNKFLHILNQIDNAAREDNPEEVFAAWQRALAQKGLTAGRFYRIYDLASAVPFEDEGLRERFETKRNQDMTEIDERIARLDVERAYRVTGLLAETASRIRDEFVPRIREANGSFKRYVLRGDFTLALLVLLGLGVLSAWGGFWQGFQLNGSWFSQALSTPGALAALAAAVILLVLGHRWVWRWAQRRVVREIERDSLLGDQAPRVANAFVYNVRSWRPFFVEKPLGWGRGLHKRIDRVLAEADTAIQRLNDRYTNPSGNSSTPPPGTGAALAQPNEARPGT